VQPPFAAHLVLEAFHRIGDVGLAARNPGLLQCAVEQTTGGADERLAGDVLLVARLLADQHHRGMPRTFARHRMGGDLVDRAALAGVLGRAQSGKRTHHRRIRVFEQSRLLHHKLSAATTPWRVARFAGFGI